MRKVWPWLGAAVVLVALWPTVCMSQEGGPATSCQSALLVPLPWGESADTWGIATAVAVAMVAYFVLRRLLRRAGDEKV